MTEPVMLDCERALQLLAAYLDGELPDLDEQSVRQHLQQCKSCYSRAEFEQKLRTRLVDLRQSAVASGLESRIRSLLTSYPNA